jgi:hypothetical protein
MSDFIINQSQLELIIENDQSINRKIIFFQTMVDDFIESVKTICGENEIFNTNSVSMGDLNWDACDKIDYIENVKVDDIKVISIKHSNKENKENYFLVDVTIYRLSMLSYVDFDDFIMHDLRKYITKSLGVPVHILYKVKGIHDIKE